MQNRNHAIDFAKYIAALMVVAIHSNLFENADSMLRFVLIDIICRLAVPFFALCTGYFLGSRFLIDNDQDRQERDAAPFVRQWKKIFNMYALWTVVFLLFSIPHWIETGWFSLRAFVDYAIAFLIKGSYFHLWYLMGMLYALPVLYMILRHIPSRYWPGIVAVLWILKVLVYAYLSLIFPAWPGEHLFSALINAFLCLLALLLAGAHIAQQRPRSRRFCLVGFAGSFLLLLMEAFWLRDQGVQGVSYIVFTLPAACFLFRSVCQIRVSPGWVSGINLAEISILVYCVHPIFISIFEEIISSSFLRYLLCVMVSTLFGYCCSKLKAKMIRKKVCSCFN